MSKDLKELLAAIPLRDDSLRLALADIERKLDAWSAAMGGLEHASPIETSAAIESPAESPHATSTLPEIEARDEAPGHDDLASSAIEAEPTEPAVEQPLPKSTDQGTVGEYEEADGEPGETPVARPANPDDDESVLVGLSPESAKAIKVQWRLQEGTKSLRQLVEEHKARLVRGDGSRDGKRSWWTRGKG